MNKLKPFRKIEGTRGPNQSYKFSHEELAEYSKCYHSVEYFIENYVLLLGSKVKLYDYQKAIIKHYQDTRFSIELYSRQIGSDLVMNGVYLWQMTFHQRSIIYFDIRRKCLNELYDKFVAMYKGLPMFMKPGIRELERGKRISFDNGSIMELKPFSGIGALGRNFDIYMCNNAAMMSKKVAAKWYQTIVPPAWARAGARVVMRSQPNGFNHFYDLVDKATRKPGDPSGNIFTVNRIYWWEVPGRDAAWREEMIKHCGSEEGFNRDYDLMFYGSSKK